MKPFLKWAGNKFRIMNLIQNELIEGKKLIEPFVGSGAVFLNTSYSSYILADANLDLINLYKILQIEGDKFIKYAKKFFDSNNNIKENFLKYRDKFNNTKNKRLKSALFIYLNKHSFNGLTRYNNLGKYNVSFGQYKAPYFPELELKKFHEKSKLAEFIHLDFLKTMDLAKKGDVVYCDPPYVPLSPTANFTKYSKNNFDLEQQILLKQKAEELSGKGIKVIISNHNTEITRKLYKKSKIITFDVQRFISCKGDNRKKAKELLAVYN